MRSSGPQGRKTPLSFAPELADQTPSPLASLPFFVPLFLLPPFMMRNGGLSGSSGAL